MELNGEDLGITSKELAEYLEYEIGITACSNILRRLEQRSRLSKKKEKFTNLWRYRYFLTQKAKDQCNYLSKLAQK